MPPEGIDSLDKDSLKLLVLQLLAQNNELLEQIKTLLARIAELEERAGQPPKTPTNSSLPPSSGQKANRPATSPQKKGRKGRPGVARTLAANPDATREIYAETCSCGATLSPADQPPSSPTTTSICRRSGPSRRGSICTRAIAHAARRVSLRNRPPT